MAGFLEDLRRIFNGDTSGSARVVGQAAPYAQYFLDDGYKRLAESALMPWFDMLARRIPSAWYHPDVPRRCDIKTAKGTCTCRAVGMCSVCRLDVCLSHSYVAADGTIACFGCVNVARKNVTPAVNSMPGPEERERRTREDSSPLDQEKVDAAYILLGCEPQDSDEAIRKARQKLLARWHPDRVKSAKDKSRYEARFKSISAAFDLVMKDRAAK